MNNGEKCPYLATIKKHLLDFDFQKVCSVSLQTNNIYVCLVCGKYFHGKGKNTPAYIHSLHLFHHLFLNLQTQQTYCLPENYKVVDSALNDIVANLKPKYSQKELQQLDKKDEMVKSVHGLKFYPGFIGLNKTKYQDYIHVVLHLLAHVPLFRNWALLLDLKKERDKFIYKTQLTVKQE